MIGVGSTVSERIERLSPTQRALLRKRLGATAPSLGDKRLVAYVVCGAEDQTTVELIRETLRARLPDYMVPSAFVMLGALPKTPTGKVDRRALPEPDVAQPGAASAFVAPRNDAEQTLAEIWSEVLGLDEVGVHDNFFELGGNSLLVNQAVSRAREAFEIDLPLRHLFEAPTIAELAMLVEETLIAELEALPEPENATEDPGPEGGR